MRPRIYQDAAARQRAYRQRKGKGGAAPAAPDVPPPVADQDRHPADRLGWIQREVDDLADDLFGRFELLTDWGKRTPRGLELQAAVIQLRAAYGVLTCIDVPDDRGPEQLRLPRG